MAAKTLVKYLFSNVFVEGEVFKVKKSSQSRRLTKMLAKERKQKKRTEETAENTAQHPRQQQINQGLSKVDIYNIRI